MKKAFIIHGAYSNPQSNWFPWLKAKLEVLGYQVTVPAFPTPEDQNLINWSKTFEPFLNELDSETILVGHSIGAVFLLSILEKVHEPIKAVFFVSVFIKNLDNPKFDPINHTFYEKNFDWTKIKSNAAHLEIIHSDNDEYVPLARAQELGEKLNTSVEVIKGGRHFNESAGYTEFQVLLDKIKSLK